MQTPDEPYLCDGDGDFVHVYPVHGTSPQSYFISSGSTQRGRRHAVLTQAAELRRFANDILTLTAKEESRV